MNAWYVDYTSVRSDPFDGTIMPILYIPDWSKVQYQNKSVLFADIPISDYIPVPQYNTNQLLDISNTTKNSLIAHYTYITPYMGSYRLNYKEYDGSHNAIDIRAPIGTPVLSIANGVVIRTMEADATGNRFIVIRHDNVPLNGKKQSIYSGYLHLSEITVQEGTKIKKGDMIGRVWMSGITTTPHLHIQIDTEDAPFHPYWPFSSSESRAAGLSFFDSINMWLGKESAMKYSIHPMNFIDTFLNGITSSAVFVENQKLPIQTEEIHELIPINASVESIIASMNTSAITATSKTNISEKPISSTPTPITSNNCEKKRFTDISSTTKAWKILYELVDSRCMFQKLNKFDPNGTITQKDAIIMLMDYYRIAPTSGTSHFLDINLGDNFQWYAIAWYRRGFIDGNYALPWKLLSKEDFIELLVKIWKLEKNPSQIKLYNDTSAMNLKFQYIQAYAFKIRARGGNFNPQSLLTRQWAIELLGNVLTRDQIKK
jgi:murein DD-endopeptidase MepM/ murein hydrolase activator NlpD